MAAKKTGPPRPPRPPRAKPPTKATPTKASRGNPSDASPLVPAGPKVTLADVQDAAHDCQACPLWRDNNGTVFGEGPHHARVVIVGEQPGDVEDKQGRPFVGPAGRVLDELLAEAGLNRAELYVTNAVKHFAHHREGKRRLHDKPKPGDVRACKPWLTAELGHIAPEILVVMGATAAAALFGSKFSVTKERGTFRVSEHCAQTMPTFHPSAILRALAMDKAGAARMREQVLDDLRKVKAALDKSPRGKK
jgi:uracil-DNA glycosylase family protein